MPDTTKRLVNKAFNDAMANLSFAQSLCPGEEDCVVKWSLAKMRILAQTMSGWFQGTDDFYSVNRLSDQPYPPVFAWTLQELREELAYWVKEIDELHGEAIKSASQRASERFSLDEIASFVHYPHRCEIESELSRKRGVSEVQAKAIVDRAIETNRVELAPVNPDRLHEEGHLRLRLRADWIDA